MTAAIDILAEANRVARRESLLEFVKDVNPDYDAGWVHEEICAELEEFARGVQAGECPRLAIFLPPRHGKSELATRCFPGWYLGHNPGDEVMVVSYSSDLANSFSYDCRDIVKRDWYRETFPDAVLETDRKGITRWRMTDGGGYNPIGIGGSITGSGADILILDDLYKSEQQANSAQHRDMVHDRYRSSIYNRLSPKGGIVMLFTRWHDDDIAGRLLAAAEAGEGDQWRVVEYPAIAVRDEPNRKRGEALHPSRYPLERLEQIRANCTPSEWESLYQQNPVPEGGEFVRRDWCRWYEPLTILHDRNWIWDSVCISWDTAFKDSVRSDRCAAQVWGRRGQDLFLLYAWTGKLDFGGVCDEAERLAHEWSHERLNTRRVDVVIESRANGMGIIRYLQTHAGLTNVRGFDPQRYGGKEERANIASGFFRAGRIHLPHEDRSRPWVTDTLREWARFPSGKYDDAVDAMSQAVRYLFQGGGSTGRKGSVAIGKPVRRGWASHA